MNLGTTLNSVLQYINYNSNFNTFKQKYLGDNEFIFYVLATIVLIYILWHIISLFKIPIIIIVSILIAMYLKKNYNNSI